MISHRRGTARRAHGQRGETLIELIITIGIMSTAIAAISMGVITMIRTSDQHRRSVQASNEAMTVAELMDGAPYVVCGSSPNYYPPSGYTPPAGYTVTVTRKNLQSQTATTPVFDTPCPSTDQGAQELTVKVQRTAGGRSVSEQVVIVKRKV